MSTLGRSNGTPAQEVNPITESLKVRQQMVASRLLDQTVSEQNTTVISADNARLRAEIENTQLREAATKQVSGEPWQQYILDQMQSTQGKLDEAIEGRRQAESALLQEQLRLMQVELERTRSQTPASPFAMVAQTIDEAQAIMDRLHPKATEATKAPAADRFDPGLEKWRLMMEADRDKRQIESAERREDRQSEFQLKRWQIEEELKIKREEAAASSRFFEEGLPKLLAVGQQLLAAAMQQPVPPVSPSVVEDPSVSAPAVGPSPAPSVQSPPPIPPGVTAMLCQNCGARILYKESYLGVVCWRCGADYLAGPSPSDTTQQTGVQTNDEPAAATHESGGGGSAPSGTDDGALDDRTGAGVHHGL